MTTEEKFNAAVNVIRSLPKNGAYQPSHDLQLRFYAYFKQATDGPCNKSKPPFWEVISKMKWDAWKRLGNMTKEEAMNNYVEELKKIVETMSYNDNIGTFLGSLGSFYDSVPAEDIEMLLGPVLERVRSQPGSPLQGSPLGSRETSPTRVPRHLVNKTNMSSLETSPVSSMSPSPDPPDTDDEDEEFIDTVETTPRTSRKSYKNLSNSPTVAKRNIDLIENSKEKSEKNGSYKANGHVTNVTSQMNGSIPHVNGNGLTKEESEDESGVLGSRGRSRDSPKVVKRRVVAKQNGGVRSSGNTYMTDLSEPIREAVLHLQKDLDRVTARVRTLEVSTLSQSQIFNAVELCENCDERLDGQIEEFEGNLLVSVPTAVAVRNHPKWWPFPDLTPRTAVFVLLWPFVAHLLLKYWQRRRLRHFLRAARDEVLETKS